MLRKVARALFYAATTLMVVNLQVRIASAQTVINVPPAFAPSTIGAGTTLNLLDGGTIGNLHGTSGSQINVLGGQANAISGGAGSIVNMSAGRVIDFQIEGIGAVTGGAIENQFNWDGATTTISGGAIGYIGAQNDASLNIMGVDFAVNGVPLSGLLAPGDSLLVDLAHGDTLTGLLADGTPLGHFQNEFAEATTIANGALRLTLAATPASPTPGVIEVSDYSTLQSIGAGQTLRLKSGGVLPNQFRAGTGSSVEVLGGHTGYGMYAMGSSVLVDGGTVGHNFRAFEGTTVTLKSGQINDGQFLSGSTLNVEGGEFVGVISSGATMNATGGVVYRAYVQNGGVANFSGGQINDLGGGEGSRLDVSGGNFTQFSSYGGVANVEGGTYDDDFFNIRGDAELALSASEFRLNGALLTNLDNAGNSRMVTLGPQDVLSGVFDDGTPFIFSGYEGQIEEPIKLTRSTGYTPGPADLSIPPGAPPHGLHGGQSLVLADGGSLPEHFSVIHGAAARIEGGTVGRNFEVIGATVDVTGGSLSSIDVFTGGVINLGGTAVWDGVDAYKGAVVNVTGGRYPGGDFFRVHAGAELNVSGGEHGGAFEAQNAKVVVTGGKFGAVTASRSEVQVSGGQASGGVTLYDLSTLEVTGGELGGVSVSRSSAVIEGASVDDVRVHDASKVVIHSGSISRSSTNNGGNQLQRSELQIHGGALGDDHYWNQGVVELYGLDFAVDGQPIVGLDNVGDSAQFTYAPGTAFTGMLADGTPLAMYPEAGAQGLLTQSGVVRLIRTTAPALPSLVNVPADAAPYGAASGQQVVVQEGGKLAKNFIAGPNSVVEIHGGSVGDNFEADRSDVLIAGGAVGEKLDVFKDAVVEVAGGSVGRHWEVHPHGELRLSGGLLGSQGTLRGGALNVSGGLAGSIDALDQSIVNVSGGEIGSELELQGGSQANITGGKIGFNFRVGTTSTAHIAGGQLQEVELQQTGRGEFTGGVVDRLNVAAGAIADIRGGAFGDSFNVSTGALATLHGADFEINGVPVGGLAQAGDQVTLTIVNNELFTGTLADGTPFAFDSRESDDPRTVTLTRAPLAAAPSIVEVDSPSSPLGIRAGQQLNLRTGGQLADSFNVGRGAELNVYDGVVGKNLEAFAATVNIHGGQIGADLDAFAGATINVDGGSIGANFDVYGGATLNFNGGYAFDVDALAGSTVAVGGGKVRDLSLSSSVQVDWNGGVVDSFSFFGANSSSLDVFGVDFKLNGNPISGLGNVGESVAFNPNPSDVLTGVLADGTPMVFRGLQSGVPSGVIRLNRSALPSPNLPAFQQVVDANAPFAIGAGQTLQLDGAGVLGSGFIAGPGSALLIDDGLVNADMKAFGAGVRIAGGVVKGNVQFFGNVDADIFGGTFEGNAPLIMPGSDVTLFGTQFFLNNVPISGLGAPGSSLVLSQRAGQMLKAILADGSTLQWRLQPYTAGGRGGPAAGISAGATLRIQMIPEPTAIASVAILLAIAAPYFRRRSAK